MGAHDLHDDAVPATTFGPFTLDLRRALLTRAGQPVPLRPKTLALLTYFAAHPGRVLRKQELLAAVWPGVVVTDDSLSQCVRELRAALGDRAEGMIRTVPRRGYVFEPDAPCEAEAATVSSQPTSTVRRHGAWAAAGIAAALVAGGITIMGARQAPQRPLDEGIKARRSIAVMPFTEQQGAYAGYFGESVAEDLVTELSRLPDTLVITRASAAVLGERGADVRTIGRELGVRHVLLGTVRREGAAVQINARFVSAEDGVVLWGEQFSYRDVSEWDWRRDIALRVARVLDVRLTAAARQPLRSGRQLDAIDAVVEGQHLIRHLASREDALRARELFEAALAAEPASAAALTGWAHSHLAELEFFRTGDAKSQAAQLEAAEQALAKAQAIDPGYGYAHCLRGHALRERGDYEGALAIYESYLARYPSEAWAHVRIGEMKLLLGRAHEVAAHMAAAMKLSPLEPNLVRIALYRAAVAEFYAGRDDAAYQRFREAAAAAPDYPGPRLGMAAIDALRGREPQAKAHLDHALRLRPQLSITSWMEQTRAWRGTQLPGQTQRLAQGMQRAGLPL
ncbi:FlgO family outer membrane protein [Ramlibacter albus]|uniref:Winged helix-turn-helix domain-containing protein n=1 Tax=Ramlibacter albus TaxID=2079448 RepID=A0A923M701_9BURK|nr:FlgO family outer membrane protein [Ramlibacter albus]MBC5765135.1 winged helix-turn-helix domain-containing protein [Ramlibacter albus]